MWTIHSKTLWQLMEILFLSTGDAHSFRQSGLKPETLELFPEASDDTTEVPVPGFEPSPEEVWGSQDHILEVL